MARRGKSSLVGIFLGGAAAFTMLATSCGNDTSVEQAADVVQESDFVFEPASEPGRGAFTAPVDTAADTGPGFQGIQGVKGQDPFEGGGGCDKEALKQQLDQRPEAKAEFAEVLGMQQDEVNDYIETLEPRVLDANMMVTNHGLDDQDQAYPIASELEAGTAVLVDKDESGKLGGEQPVTRCKCGNPLKKAPKLGTKRPDWVTTTTTTYKNDDNTTTSYDINTSTTTDNNASSTTTDNNITPTTSVADLVGFANGLLRECNLGDLQACSRASEVLEAPCRNGSYNACTTISVTLQFACSRGITEDCDRRANLVRDFEEGVIYPDGVPQDPDDPGNLEGLGVFSETESSGANGDDGNNGDGANNGDGGNNGDGANNGDGGNNGDGDTGSPTQQDTGAGSSNDEGSGG